MRFLIKNLFVCVNLFVCLFLTVASSQSFAAAIPYHKIIFFGDSLSDNGNLYRFFLKIIPKSPPYYAGQFSNDIVWSDIVANYYKQRGIQSDNYAVGGEVISLHGSGYLPWSFYESVTNYFQHTSSTDYSDTLFIIWLGANDYLDGAENIEAYTDTAIDNLKYSIERLISNGGKNFLILNLPDLSKTPYSKIHKTTDNLFKLTVRHNAKLEKLVEKLKRNYPHVDFNLYRINKLFEEFSEGNLNNVNAKYKINITETQRFCWQGGYTLEKNKNNLENNSDENYEKNYEKNKIKNYFNKNNIENNMDDKLFKDVKKNDKEKMFFLIKNNAALNEAYSVSQKANAGLVPCKNPDNYIFWDKVHPTGVVHNVIAQSVIGFINMNILKKPPTH